MQIAFPIIIAFVATGLSGLLMTLVTDKIESLQENQENIGKEHKRCSVYLIVALTLNIAVALFMKLFYDDSWQEIARVLLVISVLWACAWVDVKSRIIPNIILLIGLLIRCVLIAVESLLSPSEVGYILLSSVVAAIALFIGSILCRLVSHDSIGFGDVKLLAFMGFCMQNDRIWGAIFLSAIVAFVYSLYLVLCKKANRKTEIPFAPLLLAGTIAASIITTV